MRKQKKLAIVTGANSGIGFETTRVLAQEGFTVIMACRSEHRAEKARSSIIAGNPGADLEIIGLDLASLVSVRKFADKVNTDYGRVNILINNAGVLLRGAPTEDGFEHITGINHLGPFALTGLLLPSLKRASAARIVTVTSIAHFRGQIYFDDFMLSEHYSRKEAYRQSKLANLIFAYELDRRIKNAGLDMISVASHPGITSTNILPLPTVIKYIKEGILMSAEKGALSVIMGATDPDLNGGEYIGPGGKGQLYGLPKVSRSSGQSYNRELWTKLWSLSEKLTGIKYEF